MPPNSHSLLLIRFFVTSFIAIRPPIARITRISSATSPSILIGAIQVIRG